MRRSPVVRIVDFSTAHPWWVLISAAVIAAAAAYYATMHFAITTDINDLLSSSLPWRQRDIEYQKVFSNRTIVAVVTAPTQEQAEQAADRLTVRLAQSHGPIRDAWQADGGTFFERNGLLFLAPDQLEQSVHGLARAQPFVAQLAGDPSLRGAAKALGFAAAGVKQGRAQLDDLHWPLTLAAATLDDVLAGRPASFSWRTLEERRAPDPAQLRRIVVVDPVLDYSALQPGAAASAAIRQAAADLNLAEGYRATVRLTGAVPMSDAEFAVIREGAFLNTLITIVAVLVILWLALRSLRIILAVFFALMAGLAITAGTGLLLVGALNLVSVAFAVLFVGLGVDFGIQFSVRYRAERHDYPDLREALGSAARKSGGPLALAAAATAVGFFSFLPSHYRGLSELGEIGGLGMLIAFVCSITLVPAALAIVNPPGEPQPMGFAWLAPLDHFFERRRIPVLVGTLALVLIGTPLLLHVPFDFNPNDLQNPNEPAVATYRELKKDPQVGANAIDILAPSLDAADAMARRVAALPTVGRTLTLSNFVPIDQEQKRAAIAGAAAALDPALNPPQVAPPPSDAETVAALRATAAALLQAAQEERGPGANDARRVAGLLDRLASADTATRERAEAAVVTPLRVALDDLRLSLHPEPVSLQTLPAALKRDWFAPDGRARVQVLPKGDADDHAVLVDFATSVLAVAPTAIGQGIIYYEAGRLVLNAFVEAGVLAFLAIAALLWLALRRLSDVLLTLVPLLVAGAVTLEICALTGLALNFANIIALPLLLGVGVAFKIYYIMAWRAGKTQLLQSTLTRAVIFSAMTTATAFGSLWSSQSPGMSSMGKLMALALVCTMAAAVLFQPVLMGPPRNAAPSE
ncbi:MAG: MMPL family transporter [Hyphomicrobiales bacterium]|nr:MMPL family transporter [Hyphomicrobiales bacterium]MBV8826165.1 MMPL family transporter [Hyphomicrobiales bacterium]